jgi:hypothetical protein
MFRTTPALSTAVSAPTFAVYSRRLLLLTCAGILCAAQALAGFAVCSKTELAAGTGTNAVAVGDVNHDGIPDLVVANFAAYTMSVLLGRGGGTFGTKVDYATGTQPGALAIGDINGDGHPDVAVTNYSSSTVSLFLGTGIGTFLPKTDFATGTNPFGVAIADLNGDGRADLVVANYGPGTVSVFLGNDAGGFATRVDYVSSAGTRSVKVGDMNGDGNADVVASNLTANTVSVWPGDGRGGLGTRTDYATATGPRAVAIGDLNGDGMLDVVTANTNASSVSVFLGAGLGILGAKTDYPTGTGAYSVAIGDLDADRKPDLVVADYTANTVSVLTGFGTGTFATKADFATGSGPRLVAIEDLNGDGFPDVLAACYGSATVSVLVSGLNNGFGATSYRPSTGGMGVQLADVTGDGILDLVSGAGWNVAVMPGNGAGEFGTGVTYATGGGVSSVRIGDFDGNGAPDIVTANSNNTASVLLSDLDGGFGATTDFTTGSSPSDVAAGDLNGDGYLDFLITNEGANTVSRFLGTGAGHFTARSDFATGVGPKALVTGYFSGDVDLDVAVCNFSAGTVSILPGDGLGSLGAKTDYTVGYGPAAIAAGDLNGDGRTDLATANQVNGTVSVLIADGAGGFLAKSDYGMGTSGPEPLSVAIADLNGDGWNDIVAGTKYGNAVCVLLGAGGGTFNARMDFPQPEHMRNVAAGDLDGDGRLEIVASAYSSSWIAIVRSLLRTRTTLAAGPSPCVAGAPLVLTATVTAVSPALDMPTGAVNFFDGTTFLGSASLSGGAASFATSGSWLGVRSLSASYTGTVTCQRSLSPACTQRVVATAKPVLTSIADVRNDQGGQVRARFRASPFDYVGSGLPIVRYDVFRRVDAGLMARSSATRNASPTTALLYGWDLVGSLAAYCDTAYSLVVPTLADSNSSGFHRAALLVRAATATPGTYYDSPADSGYSVDNLPPAPPAPFTAAYASGVTHLHWGASAEADLWYYRVYRGESEGFVPGPENLVATPADTGYADAGAVGHWYKLSAVDVNGNESGFAVLTPSGTADVAPGAQAAFALEGAWPNPSRGGALAVAFVLASAEPAQLELVDVSGRRVLTREVGALGAGRHVVELAGGTRLAPGLYLARITQGSNRGTVRIVVLQ